MTEASTSENLTTILPRRFSTGTPLPKHHALVLAGDTDSAKGSRRALQLTSHRRANTRDVMGGTSTWDCVRTSAPRDAPLLIDH